MSLKIAFVYPGQGSQFVGMLGNMAKAYPSIKDSFTEVSDTLGFDAWQLAQENPQDLLNQTAFTQAVLLAANQALWQLWLSHDGPKPTLMAGHSLGEYSALVASQVLSLCSAAKIVFKRGQLMQACVPQGSGAMAAILGLAAEEINKLCEQVMESQGVVTAANYNSLAQTVISGNKAAVQICMDLCLKQGAKRAILLPVSVPSHCPLMLGMAEEFGQYLSEFSFHAPQFKIIHNVDLQTYQEPKEIQAALKLQLSAPVRWQETITAIEKHGVSTIIECGPGQVLTGLNKRIATKSVRCVTLSEPENFPKLLESSLNGEKTCL